MFLFYAYEFGIIFVKQCVGRWPLRRSERRAEGGSKILKQSFGKWVQMMWTGR